MTKEISIFNKIKIIFQKPHIILLFGKDFELTKKLIPLFIKNVEVIHSNKLSEGDLKFLLKNSNSPIVLFEDKKDIPAYKIKTLINNLPSSGTIIFNQNKNFKKDLKRKLSPTQIYSFALNKKADLTLTDIQKNHGTTFKIRHKENSIPFWIKEKLDNKKALNVLSAITIGVILDLNLVEISQIIKEKY